MKPVTLKKEKQNKNPRQPLLFSIFYGPINIWSAVQYDMDLELHDNGMPISNRSTCLDL